MADTPTPRASVVVVGGGYGGINAAKALDDVADVTLVDPTEAFVHNIAAWRALVEPEWLDRIFFPYERLLDEGRFVRGSAASLDGRRVTQTYVRIIVASAVSAAAAFGVAELTAVLLGSGVSGSVVGLVAGAGIGIDDVAHFDLYSCFASSVNNSPDRRGLPSTSRSTRTMCRSDHSLSHGPILSRICSASGNCCPAVRYHTMITLCMLHTQGATFSTLS